MRLKGISGGCLIQPCFSKGSSFPLHTRQKYHKIRICQILFSSALHRCIAQYNPGWSVSKKSVPLHFYWGEEIRKFKKGWICHLDHIFLQQHVKKVCPIQPLPPGKVGSILECYTLVRTPPLVWVTADIFQGVKKQWPFLLHLNISCIPLRQFVWSLQICRPVSYTAASWLSFFMSMFHLICRKRGKIKKREAGEPRYKSLFEICTLVIFLGLSAPSRNPHGFQKRTNYRSRFTGGPENSLCLCSGADC